MSERIGATYSAARIASRVAALGKQDSREYGGRRLDVTVTMDRSFVFAADLIRHIDAPIVCLCSRGCFAPWITMDMSEVLFLARTRS